MTDLDGPLELELPAEGRHQLDLGAGQGNGGRRHEQVLHAGRLDAVLQRGVPHQHVVHRELEVPGVDAQPGGGIPLGVEVDDQHPEPRARPGRHRGSPTWSSCRPRPSGWPPPGRGGVGCRRPPGPPSPGSSSGSGNGARPGAAVAAVPTGGRRRIGHGSDGPLGGASVTRGAGIARVGMAGGSGRQGRLGRGRAEPPRAASGATGVSLERSELGVRSRQFARGHGRFGAGGTGWGQDVVQFGVGGGHVGDGLLDPAWSAGRDRRVCRPVVEGSGTGRPGSALGGRGKRRSGGGAPTGRLDQGHRSRSGGDRIRRRDPDRRLLRGRPVSTPTTAAHYGLLESCRLQGTHTPLRR